MKVDNRLQTAKLKISYTVMLAFLFAISAYYTFEKLTGLMIPIIVIGTVLTYFILLLRRSNYFFFEYIGNKITVKYYTAHPFLRKYKAFEIPKAYFDGYIIKKKLFGFQKTIQFIVKTPKGKFKYPPLSIVLLSNEQIKDLKKILKEISASQAL